MARLQREISYFNFPIRLNVIFFCCWFLLFYYLDASPELLYWFSEQTLQPGPTVSLKCVAAANPPAQFTWTLDGFPVSVVPLILHIIVRV